MSEGGEGAPNYVISQEMASKPEDLLRIKEAKISIDSDIETNRTEIEKESSPLPSELEGDIAREQQRLKDYYKKQGINDEDVRFDPVYYMTPDLNSSEISDNDRKKLGVSGLGFVMIPNLPIEINGVKKYEEVKTAAHELYHNTGRFKFNLASDTEYNIDRNGLSYVDGGAVEEGLAIRYEHESEKVIREQLPKGTEDIDLVRNTLNSQDRFDPDKEDLKILSWNKDGYVLHGTLPNDCLKLVDYLTSEIPDFISLAEHARIKHETLNLARAIEKRFGKGSYSQIMSTSRKETEVNELLKNLRSKMPQNPTEVKMS